MGFCCRKTGVSVCDRERKYFTLHVGHVYVSKPCELQGHLSAFFDARAECACVCVRGATVPDCMCAMFILTLSLFSLSTTATLPTCTKKLLHIYHTCTFRKGSTDISQP